MTPEEAEILDIGCRKRFATFAERAFRIIEPGTLFEYNWHIGCIAEHLEAVYKGEITRIIFNMPPRCLKTSLVSILFPAWVFGKDPSSRFVNTSFKFERVEGMSLKCRNILNDEWYKHCFPKTRLDPVQGQKHNFHTTERGQYYSSAILAATGEGGTYVMSDDPMNPVEASSVTMREATIAAIRGTLFSRFNDPRTGRFILTMQRLNEFDPTGDLAKDGGYTIVTFPAEAKKHHIISLGIKKWEMKPNDLLFPVRLTREVLDRTRTNMGDYNYAAQYLQEPIPLGGGEFKPQWVQYYREGGIKAKEMNIVILVDPSGGESINKRRGKLSDFTAMMVVGLAPDNNYYLLDIVRDRLNPTERVDTLFMLHRKWCTLSGKSPKVGYEKYGMQSDTHYITDKQNRDSYRFPLVEIREGVSKEDRIRRLIPDMQIGRWWFPNNLMYTDCEGRTLDLIKELVSSEMETFPRSRYDDMLDGLSMLYFEGLMLSFPKLKQTDTQRIMADAGQSDSTSWCDF